MENSEKKLRNNSAGKSGKADGMDVIFYTDPLCCWTWAMWPQWQAFQATVNCQLNVDYKMGGLLPSWSNYRDGVNSITKPIHMGPEWAHAKAIGQVPINDRIWMTQPPASSYPACIAVKAVSLQSTAAAEAYLHLAQESVMVHGRDIAKSEVLMELAGQLATAFAGFDPFLFREDLLGERGRTAFRKDLQEAKYRNITRFPTLIIRKSDQAAVVLTGFQTLESLKAVLSNREQSKRSGDESRVWQNWPKRGQRHR